MINNQVEKLKIRGQVMLLTVIILGATFIAASTIAGYLLLLSIRQSSSIADSNTAIFAADTGVEWSLYKTFRVHGDYPKPTFINGADFEAAPTPVPSTTKSVGNIHNVYRAFLVDFNNILPPPH